MKNMYLTSLLRTISRILLLGLIMHVSVFKGLAQTTTIPSGSFIINMGITPQTVANGLKPYGLVYQLLSIKCPVHWVINPSKVKDGVDFTYNGVDYKSGAFIVEAQYRTAAVNTLITTWTNPAGTYKVVGVTTTSPLTLGFAIYKTLYSVPRWTLDQQNGGIALNFFTAASIGPEAYGGSNSKLWPLPATLDCCDDLFIMPHADPTWLTHRNLYDWNETCKGAIWLGCHAGSALENMFDNLPVSSDGDDIDRTQQTNFLSLNSGDALGAGPYSTPGNALILWGSHSSGTLPYTFNNVYASDPVAQFLGSIDAATQNGSEQIYIPIHSDQAGWRPQTKVLVYDPDHPQAYKFSSSDPINSTPMTHKAAVLAYGPGLGEDDRANVMLEASHNISGTAPANVAAMRAFFNFSFLSSTLKIAIPELSAIDNPMYSGQSYPCTFSWYGNQAPLGSYTIEWTSSCAGTFFPNNSSQTVSFIPTNVSGPVNCQISVTITDDCGRVSFDTHSTVIQPCLLTFSKDLTSPACYGGSNGSIALTINGGTAPYTISWTGTPSGGGSVPGITANPYTISGLAAGSYSISVSDGTGCSGITTALVLQPDVLAASATSSPVLCFGQSTGSINLSVTGGTMPYGYAWTGPSGFSASTEDLTNLASGSYNVTVTDSKGCTAALSVTVSQPAAALTVPAVVTNVSCYGGSNGAIDITPTGGTAPYTVVWDGGITTEDRTNLAAGTYNVTVTDANSCVTVQPFTVVQPAVLALSTQVTQPTCPPNAVQSNSDGAIDLTVTGGNGPYSYVWTPSGTGVVPSNQTKNQDLTDVVAGTYSVEVTDNKGCIQSLTVTLTYQNPNPALPGTINHN